MLRAVTCPMSIVAASGKFQGGCFVVMGARAVGSAGVEVAE